MTGRTYWWAKDSAWWRRERVVQLGEEFGSGGPAVLDWLSCEAKAQNNGGHVKTGVRSVARGCFVEVVTVGRVVSRSVTLGLLDDYVASEGRFECRISGWGADQERARAATRKASQRAQTPVDTEDDPPVVTLSHGLSRSVTECPPTGEDRTEQQPPLPPRGNRQRDRQRFENDVQAFAASALNIVTEEGWRNVKGAILSGASTVDEVVAWLKEWRPDVLTEEAA